MKCLHSKKWHGYTSRHPLLSHWISEAPALSWRNPVPADVQHRASCAINNNKSLPGIVREARVLPNRERSKALSAKASGLFALGVAFMNLISVFQKIVARFMNATKVDIETVSGNIDKEVHMDAVQTAGPVVAPGNNINTAVQIALALKAVDAALTVETIQSGTNAALTALYPVAAA